MTHADRVRGFRCALLLAAAALVGCREDPAATAQGGQGGQGGAGAGGEGGAGGQGGGLQPFPDCHTDAPQSTVGPPWRLVVRFVNATDEDLFLGTTTPDCEPVVPYVISGAQGLLKTHLGACEFTCEKLMQHGCDCPEACAAPEVVRIAAGGVHEVDWHGTEFRAQTMLDECYEDASCAGSSCYRGGPPSGTLEVTGSAYLELGDCGEADCTCTPDEKGSCVVEGATQVASAPRTASATYEGNTNGAEVELVFD